MADNLSSGGTDWPLCNRKADGRMRTGIWVLMICGSVIATGCGQKGPLYLPDKNATVVTRPAGTNNPPPAQPAPGASQQDQDKDKNDKNDDSQSKPKS